MAESNEIAEANGRRLPSKKTIIRLIIILAPVLLCIGAYFVIEGPRYIELDLPDEGTRSSWEDYTQHVIYSWQGEIKHYYIWQSIEFFDTQSSDEVSAMLNEWLNNHGWLENPADHFGYVRFNPCQRFRDDTAESQCRFYVRDELDPKMRAMSVACSSQLAALYVEYSPTEQSTLAAVTTIQASILTAMLCLS
jgi:hypothetical protein